MGAEPKSTVGAKQHCHTNYWPSGKERRKEAKKERTAAKREDQVKNMNLIKTNMP